MLAGSVKPSLLPKEREVRNKNTTWVGGRAHVCVCVIAHYLPELQFGGTCTEQNARRQYILLPALSPDYFCALHNCY